MWGCLHCWLHCWLVKHCSSSGNANNFRINYYSGQKVLDNTGMPTGNTNADNARVLLERRFTLRNIGNEATACGKYTNTFGWSEWASIRTGTDIWELKTNKSKQVWMHQDHWGVVSSIIISLFLSVCQDDPMMKVLCDAVDDNCNNQTVAQSCRHTCNSCFL